MSFSGGEKRGLFWSSRRGFFWGKCFVEMEFRPKEASKGLGSLDACHKGSRERESLQFLSMQVRQRGGGGETKQRVLS